jgi:hypothetical protein
MSAAPPSPFEILHKLQTSGGVRLVIVGGFAVNHHGFGRFTMDLDCMAVMDDMFRVESAFKAAGYSRIPAAPMYSTFRHPDASPPVVDVLLVDSATFEKLWRDRVPAVFGHHNFFVPMWEHLFAMKFHSVKGNPKRFGKDMRDLQEIVRAHPDIATKERVTQLCREFGPADRQDEILECVLAYAND